MSLLAQHLLLLHTISRNSSEKNPVDPKKLQFIKNCSTPKCLSNNNMIIGSHTVNHKVLSKLNYEEQDYEISNSVDFIENEIGYKSLKTFCFPYGGNHSFDKNSIDILKKNQCDFSFSVDPKDITMNNLSSDILYLPRYDCNQFVHGSSD